MIRWVLWAFVLFIAVAIRHLHLRHHSGQPGPGACGEERYPRNDRAGCPRHLNNLDLPTVQGVVVFATTMIVLFNLVVGLLYAWIDPRIRLA